MKNLLYSAVAAACAAFSAFGQSSPAVTERQMVKYVEGATNAVAVRADEQFSSLSNYVAGITPSGLSNYVHEAVLAMEGEVREATRIVTNDVQKALDRAAYVSNYYHVVEGELVSLSNYVDGVSPAGLSNYVGRVYENIKQSLLQTGEVDDGIEYVTNNTLSIKVRRVEDGVVKDETVLYDTAYEETAGGCFGFRVENSTSRSFTNGMFLALGYTENSGYGQNVIVFPTNTLIDFGFDIPKMTKKDYEENGVDWYRERYIYIKELIPNTVYENTDGTSWTDWGSEGGAGGVIDDYGTWTGADYWVHPTENYDYTDHENYVCFRCDQMNSDATLFRVTQKACRRFIDYDTGDETNEWRDVATFYLVPWKLYGSTWTNVVKGSWVEYSQGSGECAPIYAGDWVRTEKTSAITIRQRLPLSARRTASANPRLLGDGQASRPSTINVPNQYPDAPHGCTKVDSYDYWAYDPDEYVASEPTCYTREDWNNIENWVDFPKKGMSVDVWYQDPSDQLWYSIPKRIKDMDTLNKTLGDYPGSCPPPYPLITFTKIKKCEEVGHIWGEGDDGCVCRVCGERRDHVWQNFQDGDCDKCKNKWTKTKKSKYTKYGIQPDGEENKTCGKPCTEFDTGKHRGWHHEGEQGDYVAFTCSCQCGLYGENGYHLEHSHQVQEGYPWENFDDDFHRRAKVCERDGCGHEFYQLERHWIDDTSEKDYSECEYVNDEYHSVRAKCAANGCNFYGTMTEEHIRDDNCWCGYCNRYCHRFSAAGRCGAYEWRKCVYCGELYGKDEERHDFFPAIEVSGEKHTCQCGQVEHYHKFDMSGKCNGGARDKVDGETATDWDDSGCNRPRSTSGHKCPAKKKPNKSPSTDEDHNGNDDSDNSLSGHCPDCGGDVENDLDPNKNRLPKPPPYPYPDPTDPTKPDPSHPENYEPIIRWAYTLTGSQPARGIGSNIDFDAGLSQIDTMLSVAKTYLQNGDSWSVTIWHSPTRTTVETRAGETSVLSWKQETYSCTKATDESGSDYYDWK